MTRFRRLLKNLDFKGKDKLIIVPETKKKPFLTSDFFQEISQLVNLDNTLVTCIVPGYGLVPAEISDIFPLSQTTIVSGEPSLLPPNDPILSLKKWKKIHVLRTPRHNMEAKWLEGEMKDGNRRSVNKFHDFQELQGVQKKNRQICTLVRCKSILTC